jgi:HEAT repeat protein
MIQAAKTLFKESDVALEELIKILQGEGDPVVKERLGFLLKLASPLKSTSVIVALSQSPDAGDRRAAIGALVDLRSEASVKALIERAAGDTEVDNRERAIVGMGKTLAQPSPALKEGRVDALNAIRSYTAADNPVAIRAAAWEAIALTPNLGEMDVELIRKSLHTEKDSYVIKAVENAYRRQGVRSKAAADATRQK